ncbi:MAG TPA: hypothetical protein VJV03_12225 [Pyrinomonadaceae bacterium]|nr:hypothetical protein [Pyrinomonadaceae bacterium]
MRLKLVIVASLIAAFLGAGLEIVLVLFIFSDLSAFSTPRGLTLAIYLLPFITTFLAAMFVYRHTARRRKLQAALTAIISLLLSLALLFLASVAFAPPQLTQPPQPTPRNST